MSEQSKFETGVVSFLDILGFKGIWRRYGPADVVNKIYNTVDAANNAYSQMITQKKKDFINNPDKFSSPEHREMANAGIAEFLEIQPQVALLSDTVIVSVKAENPVVALIPVAYAINEIICKLFMERMYVRGSFGFGKYYHDDTQRIFVGEAVDDVAEWYNKIDMLGVIATPRTSYLIKSAALDRYVEGSFNPFIEYDAPLKNSSPMKIICMDWINCFFRDKPSEEIVRTMQHVFSEQEPFGFDVYRKYENTLRFARYARDSQIGNQ